MSELAIMLGEFPLPVVLLAAAAGGYFGGQALAPNDDMVPIAMALGVPLGFIWLVIMPGLKIRAMTLITEMKKEGADKEELCKKAKKIVEDVKILKPLLEMLDDTSDDLDAEAKQLENDICNPQPPPTEGDKKEENDPATDALLNKKPPTLLELTADAKSTGENLHQLFSEEDRSKGEIRGDLIKGIEDGQKTICAPFDENKSTYDDSSNEYLTVKEFCDNSKTALPKYKKAEEFDTLAGKLVETHADLKGGKEDTKALEYAKTNKTKLAEDAKQVCAVSEGFKDIIDGGEMLMADHIKVYELLMHADVDACKKDA